MKIETTDKETSIQLMNALKWGYLPRFNKIDNYEPPLSDQEMEIFARSVKSKPYDFNPWPVFTMSELWQMLPQTIKSKTLDINMYLEYGLFGFRYDGTDEHGNNDWSDNKMDKNPCNALAKLVLWCIENNHPLNPPNI